MTKCRLKLLYFYEALIMVLAACLLGIMIGIVVGYTMVLQQTMFLGETMSFFVPWG
jgi:hypothetical protein